MKLIASFQSIFVYMLDSSVLNTDNSSFFSARRIMLFGLFYTDSINSYRVNCKYGKIGTERSTKYSQKAFTAGPELLGFSANVSKTSGPKAHYSRKGHGVFNCHFVSCITPAATKKIFYNSKLLL